MNRFSIELDPQPEFEDVYVVDVLDKHEHVCGTRVTEIQLMSDGSVRAFERAVSSEPALSIGDDCPF